MNSTAKQHLAKAKDYVARGEDFYRKAAVEIVAAQKADPTLGYREIGAWFGRSYEWARQIVQWDTSVKGTGTTPFSEEKGAVAQRHARSVLRQAPPEQLAELLAEPEIRQNVGKALDAHYSKQAKDSAQRHHGREVERKGGETELADHERRQRVAEVINVVRGAASGLRFAAAQAKGLALDEDDSGAADELLALMDEIDGFASMLREFLGGKTITDEDLAELIGGKS